MFKFYSFVFVLLFPVFVSAQSLSPISNFNNLTTRLLAIGDVLIYVLISLAVVYIIWNVVHYFIRPGADDRKTSGMNILWGIVGLFIIMSIWGLVNLLINTFYTDPRIPTDRFPRVNFTNTTSPVIPKNDGITPNINPYINEGL